MTNFEKIAKDIDRLAYWISKDTINNCDYCVYDDSLGCNFDCCEGIKKYLELEAE